MLRTTESPHCAFLYTKKQLEASEQICCARVFQSRHPGSPWVAGWRQWFCWCPALYIYYIMCVYVYIYIMER